MSAMVSAMASSSAGADTSQRCESGFCGTPDLPLFFCASCDSFYCTACWTIQGPHREGKVGLDGLPHEKANRNVVNNLKSILEPPSSPTDLDKLHLQDAETTWFGVVKGDDPNPVSGRFPPVFMDYGRYATLMAASRPLNGAARYPQIVSFIGQTNAGKSTLIKMLISHGERKAGSSTSEFPSPVAGAVRNDNLPTSGDVHLYADPSTIHTQFPMLYADCEGLEGGELPPLANEAVKHGSSSLVGSRNFVVEGAKNVLKWAKDDITSGREYAVKHLYPRLLYTFSDVIVFVLRNAKTFESVALKLLLDWAAASIERSLNQPILPHAIVVLNATDLQVETEEWDVDIATKNLMSKVRNAINVVPAFRHYAEIWRQKGRSLKKMEDLILCYYSSISVVRVPVKGRYMLIDEQIDKLQGRIIRDCDAASYTRERLRMLPHVDELNEYLQAGFKHFSTRLDAPFNFVEIAVRNRPIPQNFGDHVSNLAAAMQTRHEYRDASPLFEGLSPFVASCLLLDAVRARRPGNLLDFFDKYYSNMCKGALDRFCDKFWPCSYRDSRGRECVNMKAGHESKGHQDNTGRIIGGDTLGTYVSSFSSDAYSQRWIDLLKQHLVTCDESLQDLRHNAGSSHIKLLETEYVFKMHLEKHLKVFFRDRGGARNYFSMATCYCCLMKVPQHPLPCGHVLCTDCIKSYGKKLDQSSVRMDSCPLHPEESEQFGPWIIRFKPDFAGVRVLSLDGGGVRGIIELEVLRAVERALGGKIPVQRFFDLVVGTSTGGIIALGIAAKHWSIRTSIEKFSTMCDQAFTRREFDDIGGVNKIIALRHGSRFKTQPLYRALVSSFGGQYLFGGEQESDTAYMTKVAVTSTSGTGQAPLIITNYGRKDEPQLNYRIEFSLGSGLGLKVWQAAAATSAAPSVFKPFKHPRTDRSYLDGGLYYNNPIKIANNEWKLLWPDIADSHPDIMLSIGTGQNLEETNEGVRNGAHSQSDLQKQKTARSYGKVTSADLEPHPSRRRRIFRVVSNVKNYFNVLVNRIDNELDSELAWSDFLNDTLGPDGAVNSRYIRINPDLQDDVPPLHAKEELRTLQVRTISYLGTNSGQDTIRRIAHRLIASSFYFEKSPPKEVHLSESYMCTGDLRCRFEQGAPEIRELGRYLITKQTQDFQPYFLIRDDQDNNLKHKIILSQERVDAMLDRAAFNLGEQQIKISSKHAHTDISLCFARDAKPDVSLFCISGFPRTLVTEDNLRDERIERRRTAANNQRPAIRYAASAPAAVPSSKPPGQLTDLVLNLTQTINPQRFSQSKARGSLVVAQPASQPVNLIDYEPQPSTQASTKQPATVSSFSPLIPERPDEVLTRSRSEPSNVPTPLSPESSLARHSIGSRHTSSHMQDMLPQSESDESEAEEELYKRPEYGDSDEDFEYLD